MKKIVTLLVACLILSVGINSRVFADQKKAPDLNVDKSRIIVDKSRIVIEEMILNVEKEKAVPVDLIKNCAGLAIIPGFFKGAILIGGSYGKGVVLKEGSDVTIVATGLEVHEALKAHDMLAEKGISARVINIHTIKPIDTELISKAARETGAIVTAEEHNLIGGLGSAVAETVGRRPCRRKRLERHSRHPSKLP